MSEQHGDGQRGVVFPSVDGRRSTAATGRAVVAEALQTTDPVGAGSAERETNWRQGYRTHFRRLVEAGLPTPEAATGIAQAGLAALHDRMRFVVDGADAPLPAAFDRPGPQLVSETVTGSAEP
ncbi:MAG TPA: hypothetical protein VFM07_11660, partial [Intrasporangium sp.]|nr:hypothetical protein [Intrasporangium sp.]